ncbi:hypothetical protein, partial [Erwinia amylovora]|uniref:hypothetical protein n=1 Tax=Erwinia amylovora TaxID=552 RepID=UPI00196505E8
HVITCFIKIKFIKKALFLCPQGMGGTECRKPRSATARGLKQHYGFSRNKSPSLLSRFLAVLTSDNFTENTDI